MSCMSCSYLRKITHVKNMTFFCRNGYIFFPDFCQLVLERLRDEKDEEEEFMRLLFKVVCGTDPLPTDIRAKKYKIDKHYLTKVQLKLVHLNQ